MKNTLALACALGLTATAAQESATGVRDLSRDVLMARAGAYVELFERSMATVVLEERYVQVMKPWSFPPRAPDEAHLRWLDDVAAVRPDVVVKQRRQTRSDVLLVQLPDQGWAAFRDTFEVNGRMRRERDDRLRKLFLEQSDDSRRQLRRINLASADWNLGGFYRDINLPTSAVFLIHPRNQRRFTFSAGAVEASPSGGCRRVSFKESTKPTVLRTIRGDDVPLAGQACIDAGGVIWRTRLNLDPRYTTRGIIDVTYRRDEQVDVLVPEQMWEWYYLATDEEGRPMYVESRATYSNLRRFTVTTNEQVK